MTENCCPSSSVFSSLPTKNTKQPLRGATDGKQKDGLRPNLNRPIIDGDRRNQQLLDAKKERGRNQTAFVLHRLEYTDVLKGYTTFWDGNPSLVCMHRGMYAPHKSEAASTQNPKLIDAKLLY